MSVVTPPSNSPDRVELKIIKLVGTMPGGVLTLFPSPGPDDPALEALLDTDQLADILGTSPAHLRNIAGTILPFVKIGGNTRFKLSDVLEYLRNQTRDERKPRQEKAAARTATRKSAGKKAKRAEVA